MSPVSAATAAGRKGMRNHILDTALRLFPSNGYFNTSIHGIQRDAGIGVGSIDNHFGGKEGIAKVLYQALLEQMDTLVDEVTDECDSAYARGRAVVARVFKLTEQDPSRFGPALRLITLRLDRVLPNSVDGYADSVWDSAWLAVRSGNGADGA